MAALLLLGTAERFLLALMYGPIEFGDSPTYFRLAQVLMKSGLEAYDATRVPGYPLFIGILGQDATLVWIAQLALGLLISLLILLILFRLSGAAWLAFTGAMLYNFTAGLLLFEYNLLSETLTTFLVLLSLALFQMLLARDLDLAAYLLALALGVTASFAGLVRTMFFFLPVILLPFIVFGRDRWKDRLTLGLIFSIGPLLLLGGWIYFVYDHYGMLSPTTMGGYHLVQHTGAFFERLPDSEATIRDIYLEFRNERLAQRGVQTNTIWDAIPALSKATGLSFFALSEKLQELSIQLILQNPLLYLRSVVEGWISFWKAPVYWKPDAMPATVALIVRYLSLGGRAISILANGLFLLLSVGMFVSRRLRARFKPPMFITASAVLVLFSSILQTLVDHGDNPRFLVPLQMVVIVSVLWAIWRFRERQIRST